ncbi:MAG: hypothetical protein K0R71_1492 [Bacillales bacterium]|jgi:L-ascorbate metabolism protein UlaG (beta-lactamase superfamily)|nr:hypothetical protein [Bacillales bacterium]
MKKFENQVPTSMNMGFSSLISIVKDFKASMGLKRPKVSLEPLPLKISEVKDNQKNTITWFGHSTTYLELDGKRILFDPIFSKWSSPFPPFGPKRYSIRLPLEGKDFPAIDVVVISHNHFDHLDVPTIRQLMGKTTQFIVPMGVKNNLVKWGVEPSKVSEHNWWEETYFEDIKFICTPARHFSGRGLFDRDKTLWASWCILGTKTRIFFSGDGGYGPHFKEIGGKFGPFDLTLIECGQYGKQWADIHMMPEQSVQAHLDVKGKRFMPIHWGAFTLAMHTWTDPVDRAIKKAKESGIIILTPRIGESVNLDKVEFIENHWWK